MAHGAAPVNYHNSNYRGRGHQGGGGNNGQRDFYNSGNGGPRRQERDTSTRHRPYDNRYQGHRGGGGGNYHGNSQYRGQGRRY